MTRPSRTYVNSPGSSRAPGRCWALTAPACLGRLDEATASAALVCRVLTRIRRRGLLEMNGQVLLLGEPSELKEAVDERLPVHIDEAVR